jgi:hypothetical protein
MAHLHVRRIEERQGERRFAVDVTEGGSATRHEVTLSDSYYERLAGDRWGSPESLVEATFRFLLDREPKESILRRFDLQVVSTYFPSFERTMAEGP